MKTAHGGESNVELNKSPDKSEGQSALEEPSPLPFRGLAGDEAVLRGDGPSPLELGRKSSLFLQGS